MLQQRNKKMFHVKVGPHLQEVKEVIVPIKHKNQESAKGVDKEDLGTIGLSA